MDLVIGTDEAGYGPNIGPLVIGGTAWLVEDGTAELYDVLNHTYKRVGDKVANRISVGDSKQLFQPGAGLSRLEQAVLPLAMNRCQNELAESRFSWRHFVDALVSPATDPFNTPRKQNQLKLPWYEDFDPGLPFDLSQEELQAAIDVHQFDNTNRPFLQKVRLVEPREFNDGCDSLGNKATLLSHSTLWLVMSLISDAFAEGVDIDRVFMMCDKHGGRNSYAGIIQSFFEDVWVQVIDESRERSVYSFRRNNIEYQFVFVAKGESHLPIAVASMFAKYCREVCMEAFNRYWQAKDKSLKPTAGYPVDAKRFRRDIEAKLPAMGLAESDWWRLR